MPALTMRGRYLMREYWEDSDLHLRLTADEREFYIGLWMLCDDAGWMPRDIPAIGAALYRYEDRHEREPKVVAGLTKLRDLGKIESHRCCLHLPVVVRYPRAGQKFNGHQTQHQTHSTKIKRVQTTSKPSPVPSLPDPSLPVAPAPAPEGGASAGDVSEFRQRVPFPAPKVVA